MNIIVNRSGGFGTGQKKHDYMIKTMKKRLQCLLIFFRIPIIRDQRHPMPMPSLPFGLARFRCKLQCVSSKLG